MFIYSSTRTNRARVDHFPWWGQVTGRWLEVEERHTAITVVAAIFMRRVELINNGSGTLTVA